MSKETEAAEVLKAFGLPNTQQNKRSCLTLLALANLKQDSPSRTADRPLLRTVDIMAFIREQYHMDYAPNSRETIRRQTLHQFEQARLADRNPDNPSRPTNSGNTVYRLTAEAFAVVRMFGSPRFDKRLARFVARYGSLREVYQLRREGTQIPLRRTDGSTVFLSPGSHNQLQVAVVGVRASVCTRRRVAVRRRHGFKVYRL